jgi:hypothetical protein
MGVKGSHCQCSGKNRPCSLFVIRLVDVGFMSQVVRNRKLVRLFEIKLSGSHPDSFHNTCIFMYVCVRVLLLPRCRYSF